MLINKALNILNVNKECKQLNINIGRLYIYILILIHYLFNISSQKFELYNIADQEYYGQNTLVRR